jgi:hypothetical protein
MPSVDDAQQAVLAVASGAWSHEHAAAWPRGYCSRKRVPVGTTFTFTLNDAASVTFRFIRPLPGRRRGRMCMASRRKARRGKPCKRSLNRGALRFTGHSGTNTVVFQGRISTVRRLEPGRYTLVASARNAAGSSAPDSLSFTIVR